MTEDSPGSGFDVSRVSFTGGYDDGARPWGWPASFWDREPHLTRAVIDQPRWARRLAGHGIAAVDVFLGFSHRKPGDLFEAKAERRGRVVNGRLMMVLIRDARILTQDRTESPDDVWQKEVARALDDTCAWLEQRSRRKQPQRQRTITADAQEPDAPGLPA